MKRKNRKRAIRAILCTIVAFALMIATGRTPAPIRRFIDRTIPKALETVEEAVSGDGSGLKALKDAYRRYSEKSEGRAVSAGLEIPAGGGRVYERNGYAFSFDERFCQPDWVAYTLDVQELDTTATGRTEDFREDEEVGRPHLGDYRGSGYDRGHLCPSADRTSSVELNSETFLLSNMSPQNHRFNAGLWLATENAVRDTARMYGKVYVATGPVFTDGMQTIGSCCSIAVPESFYKVILAFDGEEKAHAIGLVCPQNYSKGNLRLYAVSVDEVENLTGLDFFPLLEDAVEAEVEASFFLSDWPKAFSD